MQRLRYLLLVAFFYHTGAAQVAPSGEWYKDAIIYSVDVKTFRDHDGDGYGDFQGLTSRLGYIDSLGVNSIWLSPFQPSPLKDDGYDITDYVGIDSRVGTKADFLQFLDSCHRRHIRVIMDLVLAHTSDQHTWFKNGAKPGDVHHDWYFWSRTRPAFADSGAAFPGVQKETWTYYPPGNAWYFHRFYDFQPHLNFYLPAVRQEAARITRYWLSTGLDGFRVDAVPFIIEKPNPDRDTVYKLFSYIPAFHRVVGRINPQAALLGEANVSPTDLLKYTGRHGEGLQMMFNFYVNQFMFYGLASGDAGPLRKALQDTRVSVPAFQWVHFLRNHDEIDLGRLSPGQRDSANALFGPEKTMQLYNRGIRRRLAPMLNHSREKLELAYALGASLPGAFMIRYGEELGMGDDLSLPERFAIRTPMQWSPGPSGGFSDGNRSFRPEITDSVYGYRQVNVESESADSASLLTWIRHLFQVRKTHPVIARGSWTFADTSHKNLIVLLYRDHHQQLMALANMTDTATVLQLPLFGPEKKLIPLLHPGPGLSANKGPLTLTIPPFGYEWYEVVP